jgi:hypothetical protein
MDDKTLKKFPGTLPRQIPISLIFILFYPEMLVHWELPWWITRFWVNLGSSTENPTDLKRLLFNRENAKIK